MASRRMQVAQGYVNALRNSAPEPRIPASEAEVVALMEAQRVEQQRANRARSSASTKKSSPAEAERRWQVR